ncbi:MAG: HAMP domain-containing histidine kinase [Gammaproteobacteria bacterium]|nr:HAMP domain-containing histidine kinase [Gammaproteobacteria bacterium]
MIRVRLRTVILVVSLFVLVLPLAGIQVLRLYESALVRQTESELIAQAGLIAATFRARHGETVAQPSSAQQAKPASVEPRFAELDLATSPVHEPYPGGVPGAAPTPAAASLGKAIESVLTEARSLTLAEIRVVDAQGVVVASTGNDVGTSLTAVEEVEAALGGSWSSRLRQRDASAVATIIRSAGLLVYVASPIMFDDRVIGAVLLWRTPATILQALQHKRDLLLQAALLLLVVVVATAIVTSRLVVLPVQRLADGAGRIARGEATELDAGPYRTVEIAQLAESLEAMAESLQRRNSYIRDLARSVSHEFKTPIAAMSGALEVLSDHIDEMAPEERSRFLANLASDVERLARLTGRLLELAQADMPRQPAHAPCCSVAEVLGDEDQLAGLDLAVEGAVDAALPLQAESLSSVLHNLAENAAQHGARRLRIAVHVAPMLARVEITDDGQGVSPANARKMFEPFFTTRRDQGGTGLGLPIVRSLIGAAGGTVDHVPTESGTAFRIELPAR